MQIISTLACMREASIMTPTFSLLARKIRNIKSPLVSIGKLYPFMLSGQTGGVDAFI